MPVTYAKNYLRVGAQPAKYLLPGDDVRAVGYGFEKVPDNPSFAYLDNAINDLVEALGRKGWNVPGVTCEFEVTNKDETPVHNLWHIKGGEAGRKWDINFYRPGFMHNGRSVYTGFSNLIVPGGHLEVDESGAGMHFPYVGKKWKRDEDYFHSLPKVGSKKREEERIYLAYQWHGDYFRHTVDGGEEYDLEEGDPEFYNAEDLFLQYSIFLTEIIEEIEKFPDVTNDPYEVWEKTTQIEKIPVPSQIEPFYAVIYAFGGTNDTGLILPAGGFTPFDKMLPLKDQYPTNAKMDDKYQYGFSLPPFRSASGIWGADVTDKDASIIKVNLKYANDIYVVDETPMLPAQSYFSSVARDETRGDLKPEELVELRQILGNTLVPLTEYRNNFKNPMFLIGRPLWDDEAQHVTGKLRKKLQDEDTIISAMSRELKVKP